MEVIPPASRARREEANLTERKNLHTTVYDVKEFVRLSVCPWSTLTQTILGLEISTLLAPFAVGYEICRTNFTST